MIAEKKTPLVLILMAWILVCIPAAWGIYNTAVNAGKLFAEANSQPIHAPQTLPGIRK